MKPEEIAIVVLVLLIWVGVIFLFVRKWGKIRGLEPYTPSFDRNNSTSPMLPLTANSSQLVIPDSAPLSSFTRKQGSNNREAIKSIVNPHPHLNYKQQTTVFHFPPPSTPLSRVRAKVNLTRQTNLQNQQLPANKTSTSSEPDVRILVHPQERRCVKSNLHKPPHLRKHREFGMSQTSLN